MNQAKSDKAIIGGVLSIVSGAFGLIGAGICLLIAFFFRNGTALDIESVPPSTEFLNIFFAFYFAFGIAILIIAIFTIIGGIFSVQRKLWGLSLAGSITATICFFPCGIPAIIFVCLGKPEFEKQPVIPSSPASPI